MPSCRDAVAGAQKGVHADQGQNSCLCWVFMPSSKGQTLKVATACSLYELWSYLQDTTWHVESSGLQAQPSGAARLQAGPSGLTILRSCRALQVWLYTRRSWPSVSKVIISAAVSRGRRPVDRAAGAALRLIDPLLMWACTPELTMTFFFAFRGFDPTIGRRPAFACFPFFFDHFDWQKLFSNQKKGHASALSASLAGSSYLSSSKMKNKDRWRTNGIDRTSSRKAWIEREGHFPCPAHSTGLWQTFKPQFSFQSRTSKPDYTWTPTSTAWEILRTRCKQSSISFSKTKPCEKLKKYFLFAFGHSLFFLRSFFFFSRFTAALSNSNQTWPRARKNWKSPDVQKLALVPPLARLVPPLAQVGFADLLLFVTLPIFFLERSFFLQKKAWRLGFSKHPPKRKFPHRNDL